MGARPRIHAGTRQGIGGARQGIHVGAPPDCPPTEIEVVWEQGKGARKGICAGARPACLPCKKVGSGTGEPSAYGDKHAVFRLHCFGLGFGVMLYSLYIVASGS